MKNASISYHCSLICEEGLLEQKKEKRERFYVSCSRVVNKSLIFLSGCISLLLWDTEQAGQTAAGQFFELIFLD